jgi:hypothetical protein
MPLEKDREEPTVIELCKWRAWLDRQIEEARAREMLAEEQQRTRQLADVKERWEKVMSQPPAPALEIEANRPPNPCEPGLHNLATSGRQVREVVEKVTIGEETGIRLGIDVPMPELISLPCKLIRTKPQVIQQRRGRLGCCKANADGNRCDCLETATTCPECNDSGWTIRPENWSNPHARRCSRGCPSNCVICRDPNCDNPNGQH